MEPKTTKKAVTLAELSRELGVSRQLISVHRKKPNAPELSDVKGWIEFLATAGRDGSAPPDVRRKIAETRLRILQQTESRLARDNARAAGTVLDLEDAKRQAAAAEDWYDQQLYRMERELPPTLAGLPVMEVFQIIKRYCHEMRAQSREHFRAVVKPK